MKRIRPLLFIMPLFLVACSSAVNDRETIAQLRNMKVKVEEERVEGGLGKAMESYQRFLKETPDSALTPEAIRRLADLKVEQEYGQLAGDQKAGSRAKTAALPAPEPEAVANGASEEVHSDQSVVALPDRQESESEFEKRAAGSEQQIKGLSSVASAESSDDLERKGPLEAITLYKKLLHDYPEYRRNDQVLYQMSRAYEELGRIEDAMQVMDKLVHEFPNSRYLDEVQFRRAEYFFIHRKYLDAEDAYSSIVDMGPRSLYYEYALYKLGWTFYKQELYENALHRFIALLDHKVEVGYDFAQTKDETEHKRLEDTFRVISFSFSYLGGANAVVDFFSRNGARSYEDGVYHNLAEYYFDKRRYSDATATYNAFVSRNPFHKKSPHFSMRVIEINKAGGFPSLVIDSKKEFARKYGLQAEYWQHFKPGDFPEVLGYLKTNLTDLANHYHALYQNPKHKEEKKTNFQEALHWYQEFLASFPKEKESSTINFQLAELLLENHSFGEAAVEYEKTAYDYPRHEKSAQAGYAAVYAYRQQLEAVPAARKDTIKKEAIRSSLKFADTFPEHEKAAVVLGAAVDDLYAMKEYEQAVGAGRKLIDKFPKADMKILRPAWLVVAHSSFELKRYSDAEAAYVKVLALLPQDDKSREELVNNLAASIYKQGEEAREHKDYRAAANHFLRVGSLAPTSKIHPAAEYDAAAALIQLKDWEMAATVLQRFREAFPDNKLQPEVTKKIAYVYKESGKLSLAATEYERIEKESKDPEVRREALLLAAELHEKTGNTPRVLEVYQRYVSLFPQPVETNLETRHKITEILKAKDDKKGYLDELREIVTIDASAGKDRTERTRYLAAHAALVLAEQSYDQFVAVKLANPIKASLRKKQGLMKTATAKFGKLPDYEVGDVTAAATYYLAEIYAHFSKALTESERPEGLSPLEREEYDLAIEEQAYPFEEKAISLHEKNLELIVLGIYNDWIDKSLQKLATFVPVRYDKPEETSGIITSLDTYVFALERPASPKKNEAISEGASSPKPNGQSESAGEAAQKQETVPTVKADHVEEASLPREQQPAAKTELAVPPELATEPVKAEEAGEVTKSASPAESQQNVETEAVAVTGAPQEEETAGAAITEQIQAVDPVDGPQQETKKTEPAVKPGLAEGEQPAVQGAASALPAASGPLPGKEGAAEGGQIEETALLKSPEQAREPAPVQESAQKQETVPTIKADHVEEASPPKKQEPEAKTELAAPPELATEQVKAVEAGEVTRSASPAESEQNVKTEAVAVAGAPQEEETAGAAITEQIQAVDPVDGPQPETKKTEPAVKPGLAEGEQPAVQGAASALPAASGPLPGKEGAAEGAQIEETALSKSPEQAREPAPVQESAQTGDKNEGAVGEKVVSTGTESGSRETVRPQKPY